MKQQFLPPMAISRPIEEMEDDRPEPFIGRVASSLEFFQAVYRDPTQPLAMRLRAALGVIPFEHPKLSINANVPGLGDRIEDALRKRLERQANAAE
jgi:hypothetical protein